MHPVTIQKLCNINLQFYQTFALQFLQTRQRIQPGIIAVLEEISPNANILELGCGRGAVFIRLVPRGFRGNYTGLDFSAEILSYTQDDCQVLDLTPRFFTADLCQQDWDKTLGSMQYDYVLAFAVFHHIPSNSLRTTIFRKIHTLLKPGGSLIHSYWQFLNSPRLKARIQSWENIGLTPEDVEEGDYLLDWRRGGYGLRYIHHFSEDELVELAKKTGFSITDQFLSDGEGGKLGLYQVWKR